MCLLLQIQIPDTDENLTSISSYFYLSGITSLTFQTNKKTIGPIGNEMGWQLLISCLLDFMGGVVNILKQLEHIMNRSSISLQLNQSVH